jgi:hypothetical protein
MAYATHSMRSRLTAYARTPASATLASRNAITSTKLINRRYTVDVEPEGTNWRSRCYHHVNYERQSGLAGTLALVQQVANRSEIALPAVDGYARSRYLVLLARLSRPRTGARRPRRLPPPEE